MSYWSAFVSYLTTSSNWTASSGILDRIGQHAWYSALAVAISLVVALPIGLTLGHLRRFGLLAINITNVGRAVPTFAVLTLLILSPIGVSTTATEIALVAFALPPIVTNAYVGVSEVDAELLDVARGMGMSGWQRFRRVELPLAVPLVMAGVRIAAVQVVATATIAALVGSGGLGRLVEDGLRQDDRGQLLTGAVLVALLALVVELSLAMVQRRLDPLRRARTRGSAAASVTEM